VPTTESLHLADAGIGFVAGSGAAAISYAVRREPVAVLAVVSVAVALAMTVAVGTGLADEPPPVAIVIALIVGVLAGIGWARLVESHGMEVVALTVGLTAFGVWLAVPDTEAAAACTAALVPLVVLTFVGRRAVGSGRAWANGLAVLGWIAMADAVAWAATWGASGRTSSLPGALACFGVALVAPWVSRARHRIVLINVWLVVAQAGVVVVASRWASRATTVGQGVVRATVVLVLLAVAAAISVRPRGQERPQPCTPGEHLR
jgi:hypothetical protein